MLSSALYINLTQMNDKEEQIVLFLIQVVQQFASSFHSLHYLNNSNKKKRLHLRAASL